MKTTYAAIVITLLCSCSGGGNATPPAPSPTMTTVVAQATPTPAPTAAPSAPSPAPTPTAAPTAAPTATPVPASLKRLGGAPLTATAAQLSTSRRTAQAQGVTNGLPVLVESSGMIASWAGDFSVWTTNVQTSQDIPQTGLTVTASGNLPINNPGPQPLSCLGQVTAMCAIHPTSWTWGTSSANGKPVGRQTLTVAFADGTTGTTSEYVYDGWSLPCNAGWTYVGGVPVAQATRATSDVYADCVAGNIVFPKGGIAYSIPTQDKFGNTATIMPTITAAIFMSSSVVNVPMASISQGQVYGIATQDAGFAKVYFGNSPGSGAINAAQGMSLHASADGTFPF